LPYYIGKNHQWQKKIISANRKRYVGTV
jgi:hypothetical protein